MSKSALYDIAARLSQNDDNLVSGILLDKNVGASDLVCNHNLNGRSSFLFYYLAFWTHYYVVRHFQIRARLLIGYTQSSIAHRK